MRTCCLAKAEETYELLNQDRGWTENMHVSAIVDLSMEKHPHIKEIVKKNVLVKVANIDPPASAAVVEEQCPHCKGSASLIILSAPLLLSIWRFLSLYLSMIDSWSCKNGKLRITVRTPLRTDRIEHRLIVHEYFSGTPIRSMSLSNMLERHMLGEKEANAPFYDAISMGQLWVILHELSHLKHLDIFGLVENERQQILKRIDADLDDEDLGPISKRKWTEELLADSLATNYLYRSTHCLLKRGGPLVHAVEGSMLRSLAGAAAAINSIWFLEAVSSSAYKGKSFLSSSHPPATLRYYTAFREVRLQSPSTPEQEYVYMAELIGDIGRQFI